MPGKSLTRIVFDTNIYVSQVLNYKSKPSLAVLKAERSAEILLSKPIFVEIADVFHRKKLDRFVSTAVRETALLRLLSIATLIEPSVVIRACRDPKTTCFWNSLWMVALMSLLPATRICWCCIRFGGFRS